VGSWFDSIRWLFQAREMLLSGYHNADRKAFTVSTPDNYHVVISSPKQVAEMLAAPQEQLSFHAVITDVSCSVLC
jgi:hypothetical protein